MRRLFLAAVCATLTVPAVLPQAPVKTTANSAGLGKQEAVSNEEMNIRAYIELLRTDVRRSKSQVMAEVMQLDAEQAAKFWPIYEEFEKELTALGDQVARVVKDYADHFYNITDTVADELAGRVLSVEAQRNELKRKYYERVKASLGPITGARFLQVENQLERLVDLQVAAQLPVMPRK